VRDARENPLCNPLDSRCGNRPAQERIELLGFAEAKGALQLYASALDCGLRLNNLFSLV